MRRLRQFAGLGFVFLIVILLSFAVYSANSGKTSKTKISEIKFKDVATKELSKKIQKAPNSTERIIITFDKKPKNYKKFVENLGGKIIYDYNIIEGIAVELPLKKAEKLAKLGNVKKIEEDRQLHIFLSESVPLINADDVWNLGYTGSGVKVCVLDTGVDYTHPDLGGGIGDGYRIIAGKDFVNGDNDPMDDNGHGTHVTGIIISQDATYKGVAPDALILAGKVVNAQGGGAGSDIIVGIDWCVNNNVDIISMSIGGSSYSSYCDDLPVSIAVNNAVDKGIVVSIASGNDNSITGISEPSCASKSISVGSVDDGSGGTTADVISGFTNRGEILDLLAPGDYIISTALGGGFIAKMGTSMSTPHVSGVAALMLQANANLEPDEIEEIMKITGKPIEDTGGSGLSFPRVDALAAIQLSAKPKIKTIDVYDVSNSLDKHTDKSILINSGLNKTYSLKPGKTYRIEVNVKNIGFNSWSLTGNDIAYNDNLDLDWIVDSGDIWYTISSSDYPGGSFSSRKLTWNTGLGGSVEKGMNIIFKYVVSIPANQQELVYNIDSYFKTGDYDDSSNSIFSFKKSICFVPYFKASLESPPDATAEMPLINLLRNLGYNVEYDTPNCNYGSSDIKTKTADFSNYELFAHSWLYEGSIDSYKNAKTHYVDTLGNKELILGEDAASLEEFDYASSSHYDISPNDEAFVNTTGGVLPETDYYFKKKLKIYKEENKQLQSHNGYLDSEVVSYLCGEYDCDYYTLMGAYESISSDGRMGFFGINGSALTNFSDAEDNGEEILKYLIEWLGSKQEIVSITFSSDIDFGSVDPGQEKAGPSNPYKITIEPETTVKTDIYQKADDFCVDYPGCAGEKIIINNMKWNLDGGLTKSTISSGYTSVYSNKGPGDYNVYYWLSIPEAKPSGTYTSKVYVKAVKTGTQA